MTPDIPVEYANDDLASEAYVAGYERGEDEADCTGDVELAYDDGYWDGKAECDD